MKVEINFRVVGFCALFFGSGVQEQLQHGWFVALLPGISVQRHGLTVDFRDHLGRWQLSSVKAREQVQEMVARDTQ